MIESCMVIAVMCLVFFGMVQLAQVLVGVTHENYGHIAVMPEATRQFLAADFT